MSFRNFENIKFVSKSSDQEGDMKNGKITVDAGDDEKTLKIDADRNTIFNLIDLYGATVNVQNKELIPKYNSLFTSSPFFYKNQF